MSVEYFKIIESVKAIYSSLKKTPLIFKWIKKKFKGRRKMKLYKEVFWADDGTNEGPFCPKCWQSGEKEEIIIINRDAEEKECWECPVCDKTFNSKEACQRSLVKHREAVKNYSRRV